MWVATHARVPLQLHLPPQTAHHPMPPTNIISHAGHEAFDPLGRVSIQLPRWHVLLTLEGCGNGLSGMGSASLFAAQRPRQLGQRATPTSIGCAHVLLPLPLCPQHGRVAGWLPLLRPAHLLPRHILLADDVQVRVQRGQQPHQLAHHAVLGASHVCRSRGAPWRANYRAHRSGSMRSSLRGSHHPTHLCCTAGRRCREAQHLRRMGAKHGGLRAGPQGLLRVRRGPRHLPVACLSAAQPLLACG